MTDDGTTIRRITEIFRGLADFPISPAIDPDSREVSGELRIERGPGGHILRLTVHSPDNPLDALARARRIGARAVHAGEFLIMLPGDAQCLPRDRAELRMPFFEHVGPGAAEDRGLSSAASSGLEAGAIGV